VSLNDVFEIEEEETGPATSPLRGKRSPDRAAAAGPWRLMGQKLLRQKVAMVAGAIVLLLYLVAAFCEFLAPSLPDVS
jgi:peptide/nickel transport system permease protein